jgi:hypothetical protein
VLDLVVGAFVALIVFGLPLAIIVLFIASTLDRRQGRFDEGFKASPEPTTSASSMRHDSNKRRRIIYGRYSGGSLASAERLVPTRPHDCKD